MGLDLLDVIWDLYEGLEHIPPRKMPVILQYISKPDNYQGKTYAKTAACGRQVLFEMIAECYLLKALKIYVVFQMPGEDAFTRGFISMLATRHIVSDPLLALAPIFQFSVAKTIFHSSLPPK